MLTYSAECARYKLDKIANEGTCEKCKRMEGRR